MVLPLRFLPSCVPLALLLLLLCTIQIHRASGSTVGVAYGRNGDNLPPPSQVVALLKSNNIDKVRIYDTNNQVLAAFQNSGISLIVGAQNSELSGLASTSGASQWVNTNIVPYASSIKCIAVGNEVLTQATQYSQYLYPAMTNVYNALKAANLQGSILVSTSHAMDVIDSAHSYPPSAGTFSTGIQSQMSSILTFLSQTGAPFLANVYPFFSYISSTQVPLPYALFQSGTNNVDSGNGLHYTNLFDAQVDTLIAAMLATGHSGIRVVVTESGWPSQGATSATVGNAHTYNSNLVAHVPNGSPRRPNKLVETYIFSLFNEDLKPASPAYEQHFGVFNPDKTKVYDLTF